jgi:uncharacterized protein YaaQ
MRKKLMLGIATIAVLASTGTAAASVAYDPATGGFVGKGDVQTALGLNNKAMQNAHEAVTFSYDATVGYSFECEWYTGPERNRTYHRTAGEPVSVQVGGTVVDNDRKTGQWTGWNLQPVTVGGGTASEPVDADCGAEGNELKTIVPGSVQSFVEGGGLVAHYGAQDVALPNTV